MARGNGRQNIVRDDVDRDRLQEQLGKAVARCSSHIYAFAIMSNHLQVVLKTPQPNLSRGMQSFLSGYANGWSRRHRFSGHVFQGRYRTELVEDETYLWTVTRYVHLNPVRGLLVDHPGISLHLPGTGSATTLVVSRLQSSLRAYFALLLRPASWLALLSRTFTFELALAGSPRTNAEYDYVGKQSIPTTGLSPASPTALWAAVLGLPPLEGLEEAIRHAKGEITLKTTTLAMPDRPPEVGAEELTKLR